MISLVKELPDFEELNAELIKIHCLYDCYKNDSSVLFWCQDSGKAVISMTDNNMIIYDGGADYGELKHFVDMLSPNCIHSNYGTLSALGRMPDEHINVMVRNADIAEEFKGDTLSSKEIYNLLNTKELSLPEYPQFAVDYCRRLNHNGADYFALKDKCAVISFKTGDYAIINEIASHKKGCGSIALKAILNKNCGRKIFVCCRESVKGFYIKNGFEHCYYAGYWVKNR